MPIRAYTNNVGSRHWLRMPVAGAGTNMELFIFSGVAIFGADDIKGVTTSRWERGQATISANYSNVIPSNRAILPQHWTVDVHLASIYNRNEANDTGWAVDAFSLIRSPNDAGGPNVAAPGGYLGVRADVAVRDSDAFIYRLSYHVTILGRLVDYTVIIE